MKKRMTREEQTSLRSNVWKMRTNKQSKGKKEHNRIIEEYAQIFWREAGQAKVERWSRERDWDDMSREGKRRERIEQRMKVQERATGTFVCVQW